MDVVITGAGSNENIEAQVDPEHQALRVSIRPLDHTNPNTGKELGHYSVDIITLGIPGPVVANAPILAVRHGDSSSVIAVEKLTAQAIAAVINTSTYVDLELVKQTKFTANPTGPNIISITSPTPMKTADMDAQSVLASQGNIVAAGSQILNTPTSSPDPNGIAYVAFGVSNNAAVPPVAGPFDLVRNIELTKHPFCITDNEGFIVNTRKGWPAGITMVFAFVLDWCETPLL